MPRARKLKQWNPTKGERILIGIVLALALVFISIVLAPKAMSIGVKKVPSDVELVRPLPIYP